MTCITITVEAPVMEATHYLEIKLFALPWANWSALEGLISTIITAVGNALSYAGIIGWEVLDAEVDAAGSRILVYLRKAGSPVAAALIAALPRIGAFITKILCLLDSWYSQLQYTTLQLDGKKQ
jgi:hypothetical protein